ncbi:YceI family protein [Gordonia sp. VNQ95]|uniref:YceI family protein n=1 Tax=Gordonia TaxID=2053 RepID=UPI0032B57E10
MSERTWDFTADDGSVTAHTGVTGPAARTGHRLTIEWEKWSATAILDDDEPVSLAAHIEVDSLQVRSGEGGVTPLSGPEKLVARANALKSLKANKNPAISYRSASIAKTDNGYRIDGALTILGRDRSHPLEVTVTESAEGWEFGIDTTITQTDFGVKPYALMMGALKVADDVRVVVVARHATGL